MTDADAASSIDVRAAPRPHWIGPGFLIQRYIAREPELVRRLDPFLQLDYHAPFAYPPTPYRRGLPEHPHRGYQTVTLVFDGRLAHENRFGSSGTIGPGDVHWLHAARGVMHEEHHEPTFARAGGTLHMLQLWINLPSARKTDAPHDRTIRADAVPTSVSADGAVTVRTIAGTFGDERGPMCGATPLRLLDVTIAAGGRFALDLDGRRETALFVVAGDLGIGDLARHGACNLSRARLAIVARADATATARATCEVVSANGARFIVFDGEPIGEPLVRDGPFAMNSADEIRAAYADLRAGKLASAIGTPRRES